MGAIWRMRDCNMSKKCCAHCEHMTVTDPVWREYICDIDNHETEMRRTCDSWALRSGALAGDFLQECGAWIPDDLKRALRKAKSARRVYEMSEIEKREIREDVLTLKAFLSSCSPWLRQDLKSHIRKAIAAMIEEAE